ncbi:hypothetical protein BJX68DRAFT_236388 [Aspergillus pseudodeflectus]|uniref:Uncharacterized protein n=1 Tax=Aspergillus pseudodeflectus TaxID=176178 RepID=A0ABR4KEW9_9EURO
MWLIIFRSTHSKESLIPRYRLCDILAFLIPSFLRMTGVSSFYQLLHLVLRFQRKFLYLVLVPLILSVIKYV